MKPIQVFSEIGVLKKVLLHRPGKELENLMPEYLSNQLFDDIPYLKAIQKNHDEFANLLRGQGVEVVYLTDLIEKSIEEEQIRIAFIKDFLKMSVPAIHPRNYDVIFDFYKSLSVKELSHRVIRGLRKEELQMPKASWRVMIEDDYLLYVDPLPNSYFTRDPLATMGNGISISKMAFPAREREALFITYIHKHHPDFKDKNIPLWHEIDSGGHVEGGDELILKEDTVAIGMGQRTSSDAVLAIAERLFSQDSGFKKIMAVELPKDRAFMHLDTVCTMIDKDKFTIHPNVMNFPDMNIYILEPGSSKTDIQVKELKGLKNGLQNIFNREMKLIPCGGGNPIDAAREQWNDGSNTLTIAPGVVVTYERNEISNQAMKDNGINVLSFFGPELVRGRGGPRCMSMPLYRDPVNW